MENEKTKTNIRFEMYKKRKCKNYHRLFMNYHQISWYKKVNLYMAGLGGMQQRGLSAAQSGRLFYQNCDGE